MSFIAVAFTWDYSYYGKLGLAFIILMICIFLLGKFLESIKYEIYIENCILYIRNTKTNDIKKVSIDDISLIQYDKIIRSTLPFRDTINIHSCEGKIIFVCTNKYNPSDFYRLLSELTNMIQPKEYPIYDFRNRDARYIREALVNPNYENSKIVRKIKMKISRSYPIIVFCVFTILFVVLYAIWNHLSY